MPDLRAACSTCCRKITTEDEWDDILCKPEIVFARTSPQQKLQIVSLGIVRLLACTSTPSWCHMQ
jgi:hypothetical protein